MQNLPRQIPRLGCDPPPAIGVNGNRIRPQTCCRLGIGAVDGVQHRLDLLEAQTRYENANTGNRRHAVPKSKFCGQTQAGFAPAIKNTRNIAGNKVLCDQSPRSETGPFMTDVAEIPHTLRPELKRGNDFGMRTDELDFDLPDELIAQTPSEERSDSRLLHYARADGEIHHRVFSDFADLLRPSDLLVFNDSKVIPARFALRKTTGGLIEGLFLSEPASGQWLAPLRDLGPAKKGTSLIFDGDASIQATVIDNLGQGEFLLEISDKSPALRLLATLGRMPLPPYIKRDKLRDGRDEQDRRRYQTVYAASPGAVAAPTAGLHFTTDLLDRLDAKGMERIMVTLHVGIGTFKPITAETLEMHEMHRETFSIDSAAADSLDQARRDNRRIVAIGTTSARVLESHTDDRPFAAGSGSTSIFIYPPYRWKHVGAGNQFSSSAEYAYRHGGGDDWVGGAKADLSGGDRGAVSVLQLWGRDVY